jgi:hypothetical protein
MERIYFLMCSVLVMVVVWKTDPEFLKDYFPDHRSAPGRMPVFEARKSQIPRKDEPVVKASTPAKRWTTPDARPSRIETVTIPALPVAPPPPPPQKPVAPAVSQNPSATQPRGREPRLPVFAISTEETNLYATNSADSALITVLRKGVIVEPQMEFVVGGQGWTLVKLSDRKLSGFVNSDVLQREQPVVLRLGQ